MDRKNKYRFMASASGLQSSKIFLSVEMVMFTSDIPNLNGVECTEAFLDEICENQDKYLALPLCADITNLEQGNYDELGHCYDPEAGICTAPIIGSYVSFRKDVLDNGHTALLGTARVPKTRLPKTCAAMSELFVNNNLNFSFEVTAGDLAQKEDGTIVIDRSDDNFMDGMCVVSFPACEDAAAQKLVAEINSYSRLDKEADTMPKDKQTIAEAESVEEVKAESELAEVTEAEEPTSEKEEEVKAEAEVDEKVKEEAPESEEEVKAEVETESETSEVAESKKENAEVYVTRSTETYDTVDTYDTDTGVSTYESVSHRIDVDTVEESAPAAAVETAEAEPEDVKAEAEETEEVKAEVEEEEKKETAEVREIRELAEQISGMREMLASLSEAVKKMAEANNDPAKVVSEVLGGKLDEVNPMVESGSSRYSLLESEPVVKTRTLL